MARRYYSSTAARTTLATGVDDTTTTLSVTAVSGWPTSFPYTLIIDADTVNEEIVEVSARSGTTLTVTRGVDGTSAVAHSSGAAVQHGVSARDFDEPNAFINGTGTVTETMLASNAVTSAKILDGTIVNADINASAAIAQSKIANLTSDLASKVDYALPVNAQTGTTYTFVAADAEKLTTASNAAAVTLTIPPQSSVTWSDNTVLRVVNYGAGAVTIDGGSGVTVTNTSSTIAQYGAAVAIRTGSDAWTVVPFGGGDVPPATVSSPAATGQYTDTGITYDYYTFTSSGTLTVDTAGFADVLVVGGGGGGSKSYGGGGAGGHFYSTNVYLAAGTATVTIGAGGAQGVASPTTNYGGLSGGVSSIAAVYYAPGGGGGGDDNNSRRGQPGGSGGGSSMVFTASGVSGIGNDGGSGNTNSGSGGGGAGAAGSDAIASGNAGDGGAGLANSITGTSVTRSGGGGGGSRFGTGGSGGTGGGGAGGASGVNGANGTANTGGGGGGGGYTSSNGGNGGSGIVIVRVKV